MSVNSPEGKKLAAVMYALGWARGALSDVLDGNHSREYIQRIFDATSTSRIAKSIGLTEADFGDANWTKQLTEVEKHRIQGLDAA